MWGLYFSPIGKVYNSVHQHLKVFEEKISSRAFFTIPSSQYKSITTNIIIHYLEAKKDDPAVSEIVHTSIHQQCTHRLQVKILS